MKQLKILLSADWHLDCPWEALSSVQAREMRERARSIPSRLARIAAEEKADFMTAPNGVVGLETSFAACYTHLVRTGVITLRRLVELMCSNPAKLLKIPGGTLEVGGPADIAIADPQKVWTVEPEKLHSRSKNTVFKGMTFTGKVVHTICRGETVYAEE